MINFLKKKIFSFLEKLFLFPNIIDRKKKIDYLIIKNNDVKTLTLYLENYLSKFKEKINNLKANHLKNKKYYFLADDILDENTKLKVTNFLSDHKLVENISNSFGYKVKYSNFLLRVNFFNEKLPEEEGPKMWHRDNDSLFGQLKLFLVINKLNDKTGGKLTFIPQSRIPSFIKLKSNFDTNEKISENDKNSRIKNYYMSHNLKIKNEDIVSYGQNNEEAIILNTNDTYHKGGYLRNNLYDRFLIQAVYLPKYWSIDIFSNKNLFLKKILIGLKNKLRVNLKQF